MLVVVLLGRKMLLVVTLLGRVLIVLSDHQLLVCILLSHHQLLMLTLVSGHDISHLLLVTRLKLRSQGGFLIKEALFVARFEFRSQSELLVEKVSSEPLGLKQTPVGYLLLDLILGYHGVRGLFLNPISDRFGLRCFCLESTMHCKER